MTQSIIFWTKQCTCYQVIRVSIHRSKEGKSEGSALILFRSAAEASIAVKEYDRAKVDGRPMYVKLAPQGVRFIYKQIPHDQITQKNIPFFKKNMYVSNIICVFEI